ncbi:oxygenase MpaB family protein [Neomicrococcus aestuarii]|uniref:ER-bound oxygenase mpaB/mpaB'/Rubber oxygenase catalytic domain-containing protein n=1 Tax=Neomicrococcus aestuarii TaxID=556325 RepID=A0A1L2ZNX7_9MICC|nr:oxygenase MpaB family protein [Neomicrococcus aestuarii]APF40762.1 hypothetical protein BHE16_06785 [Neomicrococcus aestuarii]
MPAFVDRFLEPFKVRLRTTFAGQSEGVPEWEDALENGDDAGYFPHTSATWHVHGGMTPIAAGIKALLLQALHLGALAGVAEHSDYRADPLARLAGTIRWIFTVTYGDTAAAQRACDYVRRRHEPVVGTYIAATGETLEYSANDASLSHWVHCAFAEAFLTAYEDFRGAIPLPPDALPGESGADAYVREWSVAGTLMGVESPRSRAELSAALLQYDDDAPLYGGPRVREVVHFLKNPPLDPMLLPGYRLLFLAVVNSLTPRQAELLELRQWPRFLRPVSNGLARFALAVVQLGLLKVGPSELAARRRLRRLGVLPSSDSSAELPR